mmetsp:Transcript_14804/g.32642  ORF Transcript_14804/g.32642 Transcript_14804/m.32642 type:complete len:693 (+) Transcript_14804:252-2330(+)
MSTYHDSNPDRASIATSSGRVSSKRISFDEGDLPSDLPRFNRGAAESNGDVEMDGLYSAGFGEGIGVKGTGSMLGWSRSLFNAAIKKETTSSSQTDRRLLGEIMRKSQEHARSSRMSTSNSMSNLADLVSFHGEEDLCRASPVSVILRQYGRVFHNSQGSAKTYELSQPTTHIDAFLSHNWSVPRLHKYLCLALHFNVPFAVAGALIFMALLGVLAVLDMLPVAHVAFLDYPRGYLARVLVVPVFLLIALFLRDICQTERLRGPSLFLDKTCIHQEDMDRQKRGIQKLGAFLCHSRTMLVCYTDIYLTKLWTVYEIASFLSLWPVSHIKIIPTRLPLSLFGFCICWYLFDMVSVVLQVTVGFYYMDYLVIIVLFYSISIGIRKSTRSREKMLFRLKTFDVRECSCACEDDRPMVYNNIAGLMRATHELPGTVSEEETLDCFNSLVRSEMPSAMLWSFGRFNMRYEHMLVCSAFGVGSRIIDGLCGIPYGMSVRLFVTYYFLWYAIVMFFITPMTFVMFHLLAKWHLSLRGWKERLLSLGMSIMVAIILAIFMFGCDFLDTWGRESDVGFAIYWVLTVVSCGSSAFFLTREARLPTPPGNQLRRLQAMTHLQDSFLDLLTELPDIPDLPDIHLSASERDAKVSKLQEGFAGEGFRAEPPPPPPPPPPPCLFHSSAGPDFHIASNLQPAVQVSV